MTYYIQDLSCVSSDLPSILPLTRAVIRPQDGEIVTLWADRVEVRSVRDGKLITRQPEVVTETMDAVQKGGYPHFMLKEITYAHCEGMLSTEFKHGPLSAVSTGFPIIFIAGPNDVPLIISGINEVKVRGARTITIGEEDARLRVNGDDLVVIPKSDAQISALLGVLPMQLLSYHMSVLRGFDPDFPRNLSKTLMVD